MEFVPMKAEHAAMIKGLIGVHANAGVTKELAEQVEKTGTAVSALDRGEVLGIAGITEKWHGTGVAWAWLSRNWKRHAREITDEIVRNLDRSKFPRVEMAVNFDFPAGHRWAKRLGFVLETPLAKAYGPDGKDYSVYVRVS